jgi:hypothetical protein
MGRPRLLQIFPIWIGISCSREHRTRRHELWPGRSGKHQHRHCWFLYACNRWPVENIIVDTRAEDVNAFFTLTHGVKKPLQVKSLTLNWSIMRGDVNVRYGYMTGCSDPSVDVCQTKSSLFCRLYAVKVSTSAERRLEGLSGRGNLGLSRPRRRVGFTSWLKPPPCDLSWFWPAEVEDQVRPIGGEETSARWCSRKGDTLSVPISFLVATPQKLSTQSLRKPRSDRYAPFCCTPRRRYYGACRAWHKMESIP